MNYLNTERRKCFRGPAKKLPPRIGTTKLVAVAVLLIITTVLSTLGISALAFETRRNSFDTEDVPKDTEEIAVQDKSEETIVEEPAAVTEEQEVEEEQPAPYTDREVDLISKTVYGEALVTHSDMEMAAVVWCILNRVDNPRFPNTIEMVVVQKSQFLGYKATHPVLPEIENLVRDVLDRWYAEKNGEQDVGRVLPENYYHFVGDGSHNHFSIEWRSGVYWDWSLSNPYNS